jgi:hypothetical protein
MSGMELRGHSPGGSRQSLAQDLASKDIAKSKILALASENIFFYFFPFF